MYRLACLVSLLVACGSPSKGLPDAPPADAGADAADASQDAATSSFTVGGTVTGLVSTGLVLANNGEMLSIAGDGPFTFAMPVVDGAAYAVTIATQPRGQVCDVDNGSGTIAGANVDNVTVRCHGDAVSIAANDTGVCTVRTDGTLWCWGYGPFQPVNGQCSGADMLSRVQIGTDTNWATVIATGGDFLMLRTDHTLWSFGQGCTPGQMGTATDWVDVGGGGNHGCGVRADGTLWCWQMGTYPPQYFMPQRQGTETTWAHVATGDDHTCAIKSDGTLWCEGPNTRGELGVGDTQAHSGFVQVGTDAWTQIAVTGGGTTCGIRAGGTLWCWGWNFDGLVDGANAAWETSPVLRAPGTWDRVRLQTIDACAVRTDGQMWCWGYNTRGMLGTGDTSDRHELRPVLSNEIWRDAALLSFSNDTCGLGRDGTVWCWGANERGVFGDGSLAYQAPMPTRLDGSWLQVAQGGATCAIRDDHSLWCWGANGAGQLGTGDDSDRAAPWPAASLGVWSTISVGGSHGCGLQSDGSLWCWGNNNAGQLGLAVATARVPLQLGNDTSWTTVASGGSFTCAIKTPGTLWCWGDNSWGQAGYTTLGSNVAMHQVGTDSDWVSVEAGSEHACGRKSNGTVWCWGDASQGALGSMPSCTRCTSPIQVAGATYTSLSAAGLFTTAVRGDGTLWRWGNVFAVGSWPTPAQIGTEATWSATSASSDHACATRTDGSLWCWGYDTAAQLGIGPSTTMYTTPVLTGGTATWLPVEGSSGAVCALQTDHSLWCWGDDHGGQCGLGEAWHDVPGIVP